jgi:hypothetical protein
MNYEFQCVNDLKYQGILVTNSTRIAAEINDRIGISSRCYDGLKDMLKSRYLKREARSKLCNTKMKPVLIYGSESWTLTKVVSKN